MRRTQSTQTDQALIAAWCAVALQIVFLIGLVAKSAFLTSDVSMLVQIFAPALVIVVADSWRSAFKYSLITTLVVPVGTFVLLSIAAIYGFLRHQNVSALLSFVGKTADSGILIWLLLLTYIWKALVLGVVVRFILGLFWGRAK